MAKDPYKGSPYDAAGMPLSAEKVDYDNKAEVAKHMVKDKVVVAPNPYPVFNQPILKRRKVDPNGFNSLIDPPKRLEDQPKRVKKEELKEEKAAEKAEEEAKAEEDALRKAMEDADS